MSIPISVTHHQFLRWRRQCLTKERIGQNTRIATKSDADEIEVNLKVRGVQFVAEDGYLGILVRVKLTMNT
jgi:hypothetical protein